MKTIKMYYNNVYNWLKENFVRRQFYVAMCIAFALTIQLIAHITTSNIITFTFIIIHFIICIPYIHAVIDSIRE